MPNFTVRVELHGDDPDYDLLHKRMESGGFERTILSGDEIEYHLPNAEYNYTATASLKDVADKAYAIAEKVKPSPSVLITESKGRYWKGLDKV